MRIPGEAFPERVHAVAAALVLSLGSSHNTASGRDELATRAIEIVTAVDAALAAHTASLAQKVYP